MTETIPRQEAATARAVPESVGSKLAHLLCPHSETKNLLEAAKSFSSGLYGVAAFVTLARGGGWKLLFDIDGVRFIDFGDFVLDAGREGLGVKSEQDIKLVRDILLKERLEALWAQVLIRSARKPGRPKNGTAGTNIGFTPTRGENSIDRLIIKLWTEHRDIYDHFIGGHLKRAEAKSQAGLLRDNRRMRALRFCAALPAAEQEDLVRTVLLQLPRSSQDQVIAGIHAARVA